MTTERSRHRQHSRHSTNIFQLFFYRYNRSIPWLSYLTLQATVATCPGRTSASIGRHLTYLYPTFAQKLSGKIPGRILPSCYPAGMDTDKVIVSKFRNITGTKYPKTGAICKAGMLPCMEDRCILEMGWFLHARCYVDIVCMLTVRTGSFWLELTLGLVIYLSIYLTAHLCT